MSFEGVRAALALTPDLVARSVRSVTPDAVRRLAPGVRALCFDIDGTITDYHAPAIEPPDAEHLRSFREAGFRTFVISNCYGERVEQVHRLFDPLVTAVFTPVDCVDPAVPGDHASRHRKPAPDMVLLAAARAGGADDPVRPDEVLVVGDQLLKDVAAARAAGARALLVPRLGQSDHLGVRLFQRPLEAVLRRLRGLPVRRPDWPDGLARPRS
nr:HAD hydrolase-like protein [Propionibacterium sp.]